MLTSSLGLDFIVLEVAMHFTRAESKHSYTVVNIYEILERYGAIMATIEMEATNHFLIVVAQD